MEEVSANSDGPEPHGPLFFLCIVVGAIAIPWYFSTTLFTTFYLVFLPIIALLLAIRVLSNHSQEEEAEAEVIKEDIYAGNYGFSSPSFMDFSTDQPPWGVVFFLFLILHSPFRLFFLTVSGKQKKKDTG
mgnify:CR=1 FL=1